MLNFVGNHRTWLALLTIRAISVDQVTFEGDKMRRRKMRSLHAIEWFCRWIL